MNTQLLQTLLVEAGNHLWQSSLFALVAWGAAWLLSSAPARTRSMVWIAASLKFALPLALFGWLGFASGLSTLRTPAATQTTVALSPVAMFVEPIARPASAVGNAAIASSWAGTIIPALTIVWFIGFSAALGYWLAGRRRLSLAIRSGRTIYEGRERDALERAWQRLHALRLCAFAPLREIDTRRRKDTKAQRDVSIGLMSSPAIHEPGAWKVVRPVIVLPDGVAGELEDDELEAVMMHEISHVLRHDNLVANVHMLLCCLFWFYPPVWWIDGQLLAERERACDEAVLEAGGGSSVYAAGLLKVFRFTIGWRPAGVSCATGSHFRRRIEVIMNNSNDRIATVWQRALTAGVVLLLAGVSVTAAVVGGGQEKREVRDVIVETGSGPGMGGGIAEAAQAAPLLKTVSYTNAVGSPIVISSAEIHKVPGEQVAKAMGSEGRLRKFQIQTDEVGSPEHKAEAAAQPERRPFPPTDADGNTNVMVVVLQNTSDRTVSGYQISGTLNADDQVFFMFQQPIEPGQSFTLAVPVFDPLVQSPSTQLSVKGAQYTDGTTWGQWQSDPGAMMMKPRHP